MIVRLFLALAVLAGVMWLVSKFSKATPEQRIRLLKIIAVWGIAAVLLLAVVTGRVHWIFAPLAVAAPWVQRFMMARRAYHQFKGWAGPTQGKQSDVSTRYLRMSLNHDTGEMDGEVVSGEFSGRKLSSLSRDELLALLAQCRVDDQQSAAILEAYLDRVAGTEWRDTDGGYAGDAAGTTTMTAEEAYKVLGLEPGAAREEIIEAHRKLMQKLHPDRGGSTYLAAKLNQAKDLLLAAQS